MAFFPIVIVSRANPVDADGVITISSCEDLQAMEQDLSASYLLENDINCDQTRDWNGGAGFIPIGHESETGFTGQFNGANHTIFGLYIRVVESGTGALFSSVRNSTIENISFDGAEVTGYHLAAVLAGTVTDSDLDTIHVENSTVTALSSDAPYTGGIAGLYISNGDLHSIRHSYFTGVVTGGQNTGGLIGYTSYVTVEASYSTGDVNGSLHTGGLVGSHQNASVIVSSYSHATVSAHAQMVGGLVGQSGDGAHAAPTIAQSYASGVVTGNLEVGGLVGRNYGYINQSFAAGKTTTYGPCCAAGFVGKNVGGEGVGNFYDFRRTENTYPVADEDIPDFSEAITAVNTNVTPDPTYFFNNFVKAPLQDWDTESWIAKEENFPVLPREGHNTSSISAVSHQTSLDVTWPQAEHSDTEDISSYVLRYRHADLSDSWTTITAISPGSLVTHTISGLVPDTQYSVVVFTVLQRTGESSGIGAVFSTLQPDSQTTASPTATVLTSATPAVSTSAGRSAQKSQATMTPQASGVSASDTAIQTESAADSPAEDRGDASPQFSVSPTVLSSPATTGNNQNTQPNQNLPIKVIEGLVGIVLLTLGWKLVARIRAS